MTTFCQRTSECNWGLIKHCEGNMPASCKTLAKQLLQLYHYTGAENEQRVWRPELKHALWISGQGLHSVRLCVELQPFAILWGNQGIWHQLSSRTGRDSPNIQYQHSSNPSLYFHWRDKTAKIMTVVLFMLRSSPAIKLGVDIVWEWRGLSRQKIWSRFSSTFISWLRHTAVTDRKRF